MRCIPFSYSLSPLARLSVTVRYSEPVAQAHCVLRDLLSVLVLFGYVLLVLHCVCYSHSSIKCHTVFCYYQSMMYDFLHATMIILLLWIPNFAFLHYRSTLIFLCYYSCIICGWVRYCMSIACISGTRRIASSRKQLRWRSPSTLSGSAGHDRTSNFACFATSSELCVVSCAYGRYHCSCLSSYCYMFVVAVTSADWIGGNHKALPQVGCLHVHVIHLFRLRNYSRII